MEVLLGDGENPGHRAVVAERSAAVAAPQDGVRTLGVIAHGVALVRVAVAALAGEGAATVVVGDDVAFAVGRILSTDRREVLSARRVAARIEMLSNQFMANLTMVVVNPLR